MARLPAFQVDTSGFANAASLQVRGAENYARGMGALGEGIGGGLLQIGQGVRRKKERAEDKAERASVRAEDASRYETGRADHARELALRFEHDDLDASEKRLHRMIEEEGLDARYAEAQVRASADPNVMADPAFAAEFGGVRERLQKIMGGIESVRAQKRALLEQAAQPPARTERQGKG